MSSFILAPLVGLEPTTYRLTAERSTDWAKEEYKKSGNFLFFQQGNPQVSSALKSLTSVFGMGTGISSSLLSPENFEQYTQKYIDKLFFFSWLSPRVISTA